MKKHGQCHALLEFNCFNMTELGLNNLLPLASPHQTLDTCSECRQVVQLSANMISSRDTKVRTSVIHFNFTDDHMGLI